MENQTPIFTIEILVETMILTAPENAAFVIAQQKERIEENPLSPEEKKYALTLLEGFEAFFRAETLASGQMDYDSALGLNLEAINIFNAIDLLEISKIAEGHNFYYQALLHLNKGDLNLAINLINDAKSRYQSSSYGAYFQNRINVIDAEIEFLRGINDLHNLDFEEGQIKIESAANAQKKIAAIGFEENSALYHYFMGLGSYYISYLHYYLEKHHLGYFDYEYFHFADSEAMIESKAAISHFSNSSEISKIAESYFLQSKIINILSIINRELAFTMEALINRKDTVLELDIKSLKLMVKNAYQFSIKVGAQGLRFAKICNHIKAQIKNIERFLKNNNISVTTKDSKSLVVDKIDKEVVVKARDLISKNKTEKCINFILEQSIDPKIVDAFIMLRGRFTNFSAQQIKGLITPVEQEAKQNIINEDVLKHLRLYSAI